MGSVGRGEGGGAACESLHGILSWMVGKMGGGGKGRGKEVNKVNQRNDFFFCFEKLNLFIF